MRPLLFSLPGSEAQADSLCAALRADAVAAERGSAVIRSFPDGESYVRIGSDVAERPAVIVCSLDQPDPKLLPLYFLARAAREQGARCVGLVAPYLAYMRQDKQFNAGEAVTSSAFAALLSSFLDWLVTVDPHLHRRSALDEIYSIPSQRVHAAPAIAEWIRAHVADPLLIGPDEESRPQIEAIAQPIGAPHVVLRKERHGDRDVQISLPDVERWRGHTPVLADDIISTGRTMIETARELRSAGFPRPVFVGVHAVFAGSAYRELQQLEPIHIATCDSIRHPSNAIELGALLASGVRSMLERGAG